VCCIFESGCLSVCLSVCLASYRTNHGSIYDGVSMLAAGAALFGPAGGLMISIGFSPTEYPIDIISSWTIPDKATDRSTATKSVQPCPSLFFPLAR